MRGCRGQPSQKSPNPLPSLDTCASKGLSSLHHPDPTLAFDHVSALQALPIFRGVHPDAIRRFANEAQPISLRPGTALFTEGEPSDTGAVLVSFGKLVASIGSGSSLRVLGETRAGEVVGELALFAAGRPRSATLVADGPVMGLRFNARLLEDQADNPAVCALEQHLAASIARRLRRTTAGLRKLAREQAPPVTVRSLRERLFSWLGFDDE